MFPKKIKSKTTYDSAIPWVSKDRGPYRVIHNPMFTAALFTIAKV